jgi:hypothetical protein
MEAEIRSIKKVNNDLELNLRPLGAVTKDNSFPHRIYISKYTHRPQLTQRVRSMDDKLIIESSKGTAFHKQYVRVTGHHLTYQEDFTPTLPLTEVQLTNQLGDDDGGKIALSRSVTS